MDKYLEAAVMFKVMAREEQYSVLYTIGSDSEYITKDYCEAVWCGLHRRVATEE